MASASNALSNYCRCENESVKTQTSCETVCTATFLKFLNGASQREGPKVPGQLTSGSFRQAEHTSWTAGQKDSGRVRFPWYCYFNGLSLELNQETKSPLTVREVKAVATLAVFINM